MTTLGEIKTSVKKHIKEPSITSTQIQGAINDGVRHFAKKLLLPSLESSGVVNTEIDQVSVTVPPTWSFMRNFYSCDIDGQDSPTIINSIEHLERIYPEYDTDRETGEIEYIVPMFASIYIILFLQK